MSDQTSATHSLLSGSTLLTRQRRPSITTQTPGSQISLSGSTNSLDDKYGFLKTFPRELRDLIYDFLYEDVDVECDHFLFRAAFPLKVLRLVSRQVKLEYEERFSGSEHTKHLLIRDTVDFRFRKHAWVEFPAIAICATGVTVVVNACNSDGSSQHKITQDRCRAYYPNYHEAWIEHLARQLPYLRWVRIYLTLPYGRCAEKALSYLRSVPKPPQVVEMKLLQPGCAFVEGDGNRFIAAWTRQRGVEANNEAVKECCVRSLWSEVSKRFSFPRSIEDKEIVDSRTKWEERAYRRASKEQSDASIG